MKKVSIVQSMDVVVTFNILVPDDWSNEDILGYDLVSVVTVDPLQDSSVEVESVYVDSVYVNLQNIIDETGNVVTV